LLVIVGKRLCPQMSYETIWQVLKRRATFSN
jgi:hypothetical protein